MAKITPAKQAANNKWNRKAYETVSARSYRIDRLNEMITYAAHQRNMSAAAYILGAIRAALDRDGVTVDSLDSTNTDGDSVSDEAST